MANSLIFDLRKEMV